MYHIIRNSDSQETSSTDEDMNQLSYRIFSLLSWCLVMYTRRWHRNTTTKRMLHTLLIISRSIVLACMSKDTTERTLPTKGCLIWSAMFVVESFYNRKIKFVDTGISGKGIVCWPLLTRDAHKIHHNQSIPQYSWMLLKGTIPQQSRV